MCGCGTSSSLFFVSCLYTSLKCISSRPSCCPILFFCWWGWSGGCRADTSAASLCRCYSAWWSLVISYIRMRSTSCWAVTPLKSCLILLEQQQSYIAAGDANPVRCTAWAILNPLSADLWSRCLPVSMPRFQAFYMGNPECADDLFSPGKPSPSCWSLCMYYGRPVSFGLYELFLTTPSSSFLYFYSLVFAAIVGISTLNLVWRVIVPVIPFYLSGILAVLYQARKANRKPVSHEILNDLIDIELFRARHSLSS